MFHRLLYGDVIRHADRAHSLARPTASPSTNLYLVQQQLVVIDRKLPIYHIALLGEDTVTGARRVFEHGPIRTAADSNKDAQTIQNAIVSPLPAVEYTIDDIAEFEKTLPTQYIIGRRDCRHHVRDLLTWCYLLP
jgi:hypothetical protein